jgi:uncharacterized protein (TIGR00255 family)
MVLFSMTGFGKGRSEGSGVVVETEVSSLNSRYLDLKFKIPAFLSAIEYKLRTHVVGRLKRGKVNIFIRIVPVGSNFKPSRIDLDTAGKYYTDLVSLREKLGIKDDIKLENLLNIPDVVVSNYTDEELDTIYSVIAGSLNQALDELDRSRRVEGEILAADIENRIKDIDVSLKSIEDLAVSSADNRLDKLREKLRAVIGDVQIDESRLILEAGVLAERYDITEEIVRLKSHIENFLLDMKKGRDSGKRLGFIVQEMGREINTIGSKCNDIKISSLVIDIKEEIEKIREQIANIE